MPADLGKDGAFVDHKFAEKHNLHVGSQFKLQTPTGKLLPLRIEGIFKLPKGGSPFAFVTISNALFDANYIDPVNEMVFINTKGGVTDANTKTLDESVSNFADAKIQTASEFKKSFEAPLNKIILLLYVLLALSVIVSLFGIVNTLVLTIYERTRELGMLRAVGMTRWQIRSMIGYESVVTSLIGAALGMAVGVFLAVLTTHALSSEGIVFARAVAVDRLLRYRGDRGRHPRGDLPGKARRAPQRARSAAVRVARNRRRKRMPSPPSNVRPGKEKRRVTSSNPNRR